MTGFYPTQRFVTEIKGAHISMSGSTFIGGCYYRIAGQSKTGNYGISCNPSNTYFQCASSVDNGSSYTWFNMQREVDTNVHVFVDNRIDNYYAIDGLQTSIADYFYATDWTQYSLFGRYGNWDGSNGGGSVLNTGTMRIHYARIYNPNNELIKQFIPCYRKSDNKPGMYDTVNSVFVTKSGSGSEFVVGNNV